MLDETGRNTHPPHCVMDRVSTEIHSPEHSEAAICRVFKPCRGEHQVKTAASMCVCLGYPHHYPVELNQALRGHIWQPQCMEECILKYPENARVEEVRVLGSDQVSLRLSFVSSL